MATIVGRPHNDSVGLTAVGAESNVAIGLAQLGCRSRWVSRLGDDMLGRYVESFVRGHGVQVDVEVDKRRLTGLCVREVDDAQARTHYYRSGSAASALGPPSVRRIGSTAWVHVSGVTAALSDGAADLVRTILDGARDAGHRVSFDVNYRTNLWGTQSEAASVLVELARRADLVFIGDDEAQALLRVTDVASIRTALLVGSGQEVVLKRGPGPATLITSDGEVDVLALSVETVDVIGAGDAFAAGYLAGTTWGLPPRARLSLGHFAASRAVQVMGDIAPPPSSDDLAGWSPPSAARGRAGDR